MKQALILRSDSRHVPTIPAFGSYWLALAMLLQFATAAAAPAAERPVVREVLVSREGNGARIEIKADRSLAYRSYPMSGLDKWVVDLPGARTTFAGDESKKMRTPPLERITVRQKEVNGDHFTRIGLDFKGEVDFSLKEDPLDKGHLIMIMKPAKSSPLKPAVGSPSPAGPETHPDLNHK